MEQLAYCRRMALDCGAENPAVIVSRADSKQTFAAVRLRIHNPSAEKTGPLELDDGFIASVALRAGYRRERWMDGRLAPSHDEIGGSTSLMDLRRVNQARFLSPVDCIQFHYPVQSLEVLAEANELTLRPDIRSDLCVLLRDHVFEALAASLVGIFDRPEESNPLYLDHVMMASALHLMARHFGAGFRSDPHKGGLAPWQERRVREILEENLAGNMSVQNLAEECRLSLRHFTRAFAQTFGKSPYQWVIERRIERARELLTESGMSIEAVAHATCFAGQSHFTRAFKQIVGESPAAWRRSKRRTAAVRG